jgi:hypothetical protein
MALPCSRSGGGVGPWRAAVDGGGGGGAAGAAGGARQGPLRLHLPHRPQRLEGRGTTRMWGRSFSPVN